MRRLFSINPQETIAWSQRFLAKQDEVGTYISFEHKAYASNWSAFKAELLPVIERALAKNHSTEIISFVDGNLPDLGDPYERLPLDSSWREMTWQHKGETIHIGKLGNCVSLLQHLEGQAPHSTDGLVPPTHAW